MRHHQVLSLTERAELRDVVLRGTAPYGEDHPSEPKLAQRPPFQR
jgi:hypothetical protein